MDIRCLIVGVANGGKELKQENGLGKRDHHILTINEWRSTHCHLKSSLIAKLTGLVT